MPERGYTLIELLVAIIILSILTVAIVPFTISMIRTTFIYTPQAMSKAEATFLTNGRFIDMLYPMKFAVATESSDRRSDNITDPIYIYNWDDVSSFADMKTALSETRFQISGTLAYLNSRVYPALPGVNITSLSLFYGDKIIAPPYKPFSNLTIHYIAQTRDNQTITGTVGMTKLTQPFPLPWACYEDGTQTSTTERVINLYFTQPIKDNPDIVNSPDNYIEIKCGNFNTTINSVDFISKNPAHIQYHIAIDSAVSPITCQISFKDSDILESYDGYAMKDLIDVVNGSPYIEVNGTCP